MAEFTATAERFHVHATDGHRTAEYDIDVPTAHEAIAIAKERWAKREPAKAREAVDEAALAEAVEDAVPTHEERPDRRRGRR